MMPAIPNLESADPNCSQESTKEVGLVWLALKSFSFVVKKKLDMNIINKCKRFLLVPFCS